MKNQTPKKSYGRKAGSNPARPTTNYTCLSYTPNILDIDISQSKIQQKKTKGNNGGMCLGTYLLKR